MRTMISLAMLAVPGAAYAQTAEPAGPSILAQWNDPIAPAADVAPFTEQLSPAVLLDEPAEGALAIAALPAVAFAEIPGADIAITDAADIENAGGQPVALADQADALFGMAPVSEDELAQTKGREQDGWLVAIGNINSNVSDNHVANSPTGNITISDSSFNGVNGFAMVNINTGTAGSINSEMVVNLQINYAPGQ